MTVERWTDEMLDRFASTVSVTLAGIGNAQTGLSQNVDRLTQRVDQFITRTDETIAELRAGQQQQARVLDYLLRKEQERQNGDSQTGQGGVDRQA
jgi:uncharacterized protein YoxC